MNAFPLTEANTAQELRRRTLLRGLGAGALFAGIGSLTSACTPVQNSPTAALGPTGEPRRGGTLRIGARALQITGEAVAVNGGLMMD
jgi:hypothetical protein